MRLLQNIIKETLRLHVPCKCSYLSSREDRFFNGLKVGFNIRTALRDTVLPTGGGPAGKDPVGVLQGTHICTLTLSPPQLQMLLACVFTFH